MNGVWIERAGPMMTVQDLGRAGNIALGLSRGGAMDRRAILEAAAILGAGQALPAIEMAGMGGVFRAQSDVRFALTGAPMVAQIDGTEIAWNVAHFMLAGQRLTIGGMLAGSYGYLTFAGGIKGGEWHHSQSTHLTAGIGRLLAAHDFIEILADPSPDFPPQRLDVQNRFSGGVLRLMPGPQTAIFDPLARARMEVTAFRRHAQSNRQGIRLEADTPFTADAAQLLSDAILCGDVQMTGAGLPYILMAECQTIGGYPRIGTVIAEDIPRAAQAPVSAELRFEWLTVDEADRLFQSDRAILAQLRKSARPTRRDPAQITDLLAYQLISGMTCGDELEDANDANN